MSQKTQVSSLSLEDAFAEIDAFIKDGGRLAAGKHDASYAKVAQRGETALKGLEALLASKKLADADKAKGRFGTLDKGELAAALNVRAGGTRLQAAEKCVIVDGFLARIEETIFTCLVELGHTYLNEHIVALKDCCDLKNPNPDGIQALLDSISASSQVPAVCLRRRAIKAKLMKLAKKSRFDQTVGDKALESLYGYTAAAKDGLAHLHELGAELQAQNGRKIFEAIGHDAYDHNRVVDQKRRNACAATLMARSIGWSPEAWNEGFAKIRRIVEMAKQFVPAPNGAGAEEIAPPAVPASHPAIEAAEQAQAQESAESRDVIPMTDRLAS